MPGAGLYSAGMHPFGYSSEIAAPGYGKVFLDEFGAQHTCRRINIETGDYEVNDDNDGRLYGQTSAEQMVTLAIRTTRGKAALQSLGQGVMQIRTFGTNWVERVQEDIRVALTPAIDQGILELVSVEAARQGTGGFAAIRILWRDTETGQLEEQTFG